MPRKAKFYRLRNGRARGSGRIYLITITCHGRQAHFATLQSGRCFVQALPARRQRWVATDFAFWTVVARSACSRNTSNQ